MSSEKQLYALKIPILNEYLQWQKKEEKKKERWLESDCNKQKFPAAQKQ